MHPACPSTVWVCRRLLSTPARTRRIGNLSFHSMHKSGNYSDHESSGSTHDAYTDVTVHHDSGTFTDSDYYKHDLRHY